MRATDRVRDRLRVCVKGGGKCECWFDLDRIFIQYAPALNPFQIPNVRISTVLQGESSGIAQVSQIPWGLLPGF